MVECAREICKELRTESKAYAAAEEQFLYAPLLLDEPSLGSSRHALKEHHEIDECVEALGKARKKPEAWPELAKRLSHEVHHHLKEEETKFFQISGKILSDRLKSILAGNYRRDLKRMRAVEA